VKHPIVWRRVDQRAVLRAWAIAEATSAKEGLGRAIAADQASSELRDKLIAGRYAELNDVEWHWLESAIMQLRAPLLRGLLALGPDWYEGEVPVSFLDGMRFFNLPAWVRRAPSRRFADLALSREKPETNEPEVRGFGTAVERPIAVGPSLEGPFCLLEGYTRCGCSEGLPGRTLIAGPFTDGDRGNLKNRRVVERKRPSLVVGRGGARRSVQKGGLAALNISLARCAAKIFAMSSASPKGRTSACSMLRTQASAEAGPSRVWKVTLHPTFVARFSASKRASSW